MNTFINEDKLFLTEELFKSMVSSSRNVTDTQSIFYSIALSQKKTIKDILGLLLYNDILLSYTNYVDSGTTIETHYDYLIHNYVQPILAFSTYKRLILNLSFKLKESGLRSSINQVDELVQYQDRNVIMSEITDDIDVFIKDMKKYIYDNRTYFPLYEGSFTNVNSEKVELNIGKINNPSKNIYSDGIQKRYYR